jgi:hypothetical protein
VTFEEIIQGANLSGIYQGKQCPVCGCVDLVDDPTPGCVQCAARMEDESVRVERIAVELDHLEAGAKLLPPEGRQQLRVHMDYLMARAARISMGVNR